MQAASLHFHSEVQVRSTGELLRTYCVRDAVLCTLWAHFPILAWATQQLCHPHCKNEAQRTCVALAWDPRRVCDLTTNHSLPFCLLPQRREAAAALASEPLSGPPELPATRA